MKKKTISLFLVVALAFGVLTLAGCNWFTASRIKFVNPPATTYVLGEAGDLDFTIQVTEGTTTTEYNYQSYKDLISVSNFSTETVGTRTAYIRFDNKLRLSFTYTVLDGDFAGGTGTQTDPYLVSTPDQLANALEENEYKYFKLTRTMDFKDAETRMANIGDKATSDQAFSGVIDGGGYSLLNVASAKTVEGDSTNKYNELFGRVASKENGKFVLKNITIDFGASGDSAVPGIAFANGEDAEIEFENVTVTGYIDAQYTNNSCLSPFVNFVNRSVSVSGGKRSGTGYAIKSLSFKNCHNSVKILNSYSVNAVAGYVATMGTVFPGNVTFENCTFDGVIEGSLIGESGIGAFVTDTSTVYNSANPQYVFTNCSAKGAKIIQTDGTKACGVVCIGPKTSAQVTTVPGITCDEDLVDSSLKTMDVSAGTDKLTITATPDASVIDSVTSYKVFAYGSMTYWTAKPLSGGGGFRCVEPVNASEVENGVLTKTLYKIGYNNVDSTDNIDDKCGSPLFVLNNNVITYYCATVCQDVNAISKVIVVAYDASGKAVALGSIATSGNLNIYNGNVNA